MNLNDYFDPVSLEKELKTRGFNATVVRIKESNSNRLYGTRRIINLILGANPNSEVPGR